MTLDDQTVSSVRAALARGDLLTAYDEVIQGKALGLSGLDYLEVLTLARLGDTERALRLYDEYQLAAMDDADSLSLKARLLKDQAFAAGSQPDMAKLLEACELYAAVYRHTRSSYPAINAATLAYMAGRTRLANRLARAVVRKSLVQARQDYFSLATVAEALIVLEDLEGAHAALSKAIQAPDADVGARSTTVLQLQRFAATTGNAEAMGRLLQLVLPPKVAMFCGNIFVADEALEARLRTEVGEAIRRENIGFAYGALAAGADILIAEELLKNGAELHIVLPCAEADFLEQSVAPAGQEWVARYEACKARAASMNFASKMSYVGEGAQFAYGSSVTMGMARLRARHLHSEAIQLAIVQGTGAATLSGSDIDAWQKCGGRSVVVRAGKLTRPTMPPPPPRSKVERGAYGLLFSDYPGFADLDERVLPLFWDEVMGRIAELLKRYAHGIRQGNTWGDAIYVVFENASLTAAAALELCDLFHDVNHRALGVPEGTAMRFALHYGPTYVGHDPVSGRATYYGTEVSRTARIEPVTPSGSVYVTEPFAAVLEMEATHQFVCNYVGKTPLAKGYGVYPLYRLSRAPLAATSEATQPRRRVTSDEPSAPSKASAR